MKRPMEVDTFWPGDRVRVPLTGWTGTVVEKSKVKGNGYLVRWDEEWRATNEFAPETSWVRPLNLEKETD